MRALPALALGPLLPLLAAGCGDALGQADAGAPLATSDYFGLQIGRCFEYTSSDTAQMAPDLGIGDPAAIDGFVKMEFNFALDDSSPMIAYKLQSIRNLGNLPGKADPPCGGAP